MARLLECLKPLQVQRLGEGLHPDGGGLYLQVTGEAGRSWIFRYWVDGRERQMGLGATHTVSLSEARDAAREARRQRSAGLDPIEERRKIEVEQKLERSRSVTFDDAVDAFIEASKAAWGNEKHIKQWKSTLTTYATPRIGKLPVGEVETRHVVAVLEPIWQSKTETASRVRGRIENVLDWATVYGHRLSPWLGHLMVSHQETARPLLTPGEVMQLPPHEAVVLVAGAPPIRATKIRYYADPRMAGRVRALERAAGVPPLAMTPGGHRWNGRRR